MTNAVVFHTPETTISKNTRKLLTEHLGSAFDLVEYHDNFAAKAEISYADPNLLVVFGESFGKELFEHGGDFEDIAYNIRECKVVGRPRIVLVLPTVIKMSLLEQGLARMEELRG